MEVTQAQVDSLYEKLKKEGQAAGYYLNPDVRFTKELVHGLLVNEGRYGYQACPCRLATGDEAQDLDIVCPCDYRDADVAEHGACYCALYVSSRVLSGDQTVQSIPERRKPVEERAQAQVTARAAVVTVSLPVWRCKVCGYLCARDQPPDVCPICKAKRERFERFL